MKHTTSLLALFSLVLSLSACSDKTPTSEAAKPSETVVATAETSHNSSPTKSTDAAEADAGEDSGHPPMAAEPKEENGVLQLAWEHLAPQGYDADTMMAKYQDQIGQVGQGSPEEKALLDTIMEEFSKAPTKPELAGKHVQIAGYVSPLAEKDGQIAEFLLIPYVGSSLEMPPPPANQVILVKPKAGQSIASSDMYQPVSVIGDLKVESVATEAGKAGYQLDNAEVQPYSESSLPGAEEMDQEDEEKDPAQAAPMPEQPQPDTKP